MGRERASPEMLAIAPWLVEHSQLFSRAYGAAPGFPCSTDARVVFSGGQPVAAVWGGQFGSVSLMRGGPVGPGIGPEPEALAMYALHQRILPTHLRVLLVCQTTGIG